MGMPEKYISYWKFEDRPALFTSQVFWKRLSGGKGDRALRPVKGCALMGYIT
jgi:hypothetical protein